MKVPATLFSLVLAGAVFVAMPASGNQAAADKKEATAVKKEKKWQGKGIRNYKDESMMDIQGGPPPPVQSTKVAYGNSPERTQLGKPREKDEVKEGSVVIVLGKVEDKGV